MTIRVHRNSRLKASAWLKTVHSQQSLRKAKAYVRGFSLAGDSILVSAQLKVPPKQATGKGRFVRWYELVCCAAQPVTKEFPNNTWFVTTGAVVGSKWTGHPKSDFGPWD